MSIILKMLCMVRMSMVLVLKVMTMTITMMILVLTVIVVIFMVKVSGVIRMIVMLMMKMVFVVVIIKLMIKRMMLRKKKTFIYRIHQRLKKTLKKAVIVLEHSPISRSRKQTLPSGSNATVSGLIQSDWNRSWQSLTYSKVRQHSRHSAHSSSSSRNLPRVASTSASEAVLISSPSSGSSTPPADTPRSSSVMEHGLPMLSIGERSRLAAVTDCLGSR